MNISLDLIAVIAGYLIGAVSFARLTVKLINPKVSLDKARTFNSESGETGSISGIGASTASIALGTKYGFLVTFLDMLKVFIPTLTLRAMYPNDSAYLLYSFFAIIGHNWPVYYRFQGGRGLSAMLGSLMAVEPIGAILAVILGTLTAILINYPPSSLILWFPFLTLIIWFMRHDIALIVYSITLPILFILAEIPDIRLARQYQRQGRMDEYNHIILNSSSQMRGMKRLAGILRFWEKKKENL
jgi:glycerol-3-phosphate acyltransferase PlsY